MATIDRLHELIAPIVSEAEADLYDLELAGGVLKVTLDRSGGIDIGTIGSVTRSISHMLDEKDPIPGEFTLEVSSPGLERVLRTPAHYERAVGEQVNLKLRAGVDGDRRLKATVTAAGPLDITVTPNDSDADPVRIAYDDIERARTIFDWGPAPKPRGKAPKTAASSTKKSTKADSSTNKKASKS